MGARRKKDSVAEVSLIAFISLLSVLICSLLLTAIWTHVGTLDIKQAIGQPSTTKKAPDPVLWAHFQKDGSLVFEVKNSAKFKKALRLPALIPGESRADLLANISALKANLPTLRTVLIKPTARTLYENIILLMDDFKTVGSFDLGVVPL